MRTSVDNSRARSAIRPLYFYYNRYSLYELDVVANSKLKVSLVELACLTFANLLWIGRFGSGRSKSVTVDRDGCREIL